MVSRVKCKLNGMPFKAIHLSAQNHPVSAGCCAGSWRVALTAAAAPRSSMWPMPSAQTPVQCGHLGGGCWESQANMAKEPDIGIAGGCPHPPGQEGDEKGS